MNSCKERGGALSSDGGDRRWYAVQTRSNVEKSLCAGLETGGIENYCPAFREVHQWADRKKAIDRPLFPGYVFVRFEDGNEKARLQVLKTPGAVRILGGASKIDPIPDSEVESVRRMLDSGRPWTAHPFLKEGSRVRVRRGSMKNAEGILVRIKNETRLVVSINLFSQSIATEIDLRDVEAI
jgi:transcription antitermination factor NusG